MFAKETHFVAPPEMRYDLQHPFPSLLLQEIITWLAPAILVAADLCQPYPPFGCPFRTTVRVGHPFSDCHKLDGTELEIWVVFHQQDGTILSMFCSLQNFHQPEVSSRLETHGRTVWRRPRLRFKTSLVAAFLASCGSSWILYRSLQS